MGAQPQFRYMGICSEVIEQSAACLLGCCCCCCCCCRLDHIKPGSIKSWHRVSQTECLSQLVHQ